MTIEELRKIAEAEHDAEKKFQHHVCVCIAAGCLSSGADHVRDALKKEVAESGMKNEVLVKGVGCMGLCSAGPLVTVETENQMFANVTPEAAPEIIRSLDTGGDPTAGGLHPCPTNVPFFERQKRIVLENSGKIDPERIEDYIAHDGYVALVTAITEMTPLEVIDQVKSSGLRGRGGAGYPTGLKWSTVAKTGEQQKYVICNADEGDPGAFMDRAVLESDPHRVLEGMAIAAYAVGAQRGFIYVRAEYPLAVKHLKTAIKQAERLG
ncbi:MAG TPA: NAD(P)H-dependent oxidoreductase subunit E, partial [Steroidobacteraceae bacterium]